jgi:hypothetical protein
MRRKWDFFIAHAGGDTNVAEKLYAFLKPRSKVFLDSKELILGDTWDQKLAEEQKQSLITIVIVSPRTEQAYYQREEIAVAIRMARNDSQKHRVIPIFMPGCDKEKVPYGLTVIHSLTLNSESEMGFAAERVLDALHKTRKKPRSIKNIEGVNASDSLEKALETLNQAKEMLNARLDVFDKARITPQNCDESVRELLEIKGSSSQFLINNDSKSVVNQRMSLYKFEEDILSIVDSIREFRKISVQTDSEDIKQQIISGTQNLIKDVDSIILKIKG